LIIFSAFAIVIVLFARDTIINCFEYDLKFAISSLVLCFVYNCCCLQLLSVVFLLLTRIQTYNQFLKLIENLKNAQTYLKIHQTLLLKLLDVIKLINQGFGFQFMLQTVSLCTYGIYAIFTSFEGFVRKNKQFQGMALTLIYLNSYDFCIFIIFCILSTLIKREIDKSMKISRKIISKNKKIVNMECLIDEKLTKFNCGLFPFDWKFFVSVSMKLFYQSSLVKIAIK
jgi:hypothetical protein